MSRDLDKYIDFMIESIKQERKIKNTEEKNSRFDQEHRRNQKRFEYDYEEDLYEPIYDDYDYQFPNNSKNKINNFTLVTFNINNIKPGLILFP